MPAAKGSLPWNAGTSKGWLDKRGYRWIYVTENGVRRAKKEHRHVFEVAHGVKLSPEQVVHHINGDKSDNRLENLEVKEWGVHTSDHHKGTKQSEQAKITQGVIAEYREENKRLKSINADMLEALRAIDASWTEAFPGGPDGDLTWNVIGRMSDDTVEIWRKIRAAIRKAEGAA